MGLPDKEFKTTIINKQWTANREQGWGTTHDRQISNTSKLMQVPTKNQKETVQIKNSVRA